MIKRTIVSTVVLFAFTMTSSGTLAHARSAWERARATKRIEETRSMSESQQIAQKLHTVLSQWDKVGGKVEEALSADKLEQTVETYVSRQVAQIDSMTNTQINELHTQLQAAQKTAAKAGDVATAEKLEAALDSNVSVRDQLRRQFMGARQGHMAELLQTDIEAAGGVKEYFESALVKLTTKNAAAAWAIVGGVLALALLIVLLIFFWWLALSLGIVGVVIFLIIIL